MMTRTCFIVAGDSKSPRKCCYDSWESLNIVMWHSVVCTVLIVLQLTGTLFSVRYKLKLRIELVLVFVFEGFHIQISVLKT